MKKKSSYKCFGLWAQWYSLLITALGDVGNYKDTAGDTRDDEDKAADGTATPVKDKGGKGKSNTSTPTLTPEKRRRSALEEVPDTHSQSSSQTRSRSQSAANSQIHLRSRSVGGLSRSKQWIREPLSIGLKGIQRQEDQPQTDIKNIPSSS